MNNKGQSLVEFVLILPVVLMIIFIVIDFSNIFYQKNHLETIINEISDLKENKEPDKYIEKKYKEVSITYKNQNKTLKIIVTKDIKLVTPLSSTIFNNPYRIKTERTIIYEQ